MLTLIINIVLWNCVWFATILGAAAGHGWAGPVAVACVFVVHMLFISSNRKYDALLVVVLVLIGFVADSVVGLLGAVDFGPLAYAGPLAPPFMLALWANLALLLNYSLRWLHGKYAIAIAMGAIGGPSAYFTGARLGAVTLPDPLWYSLLIIALEWAIAMALILWIMERAEKYPVFNPRR